MAPRKENRKKPHRNAKVQNKAIKKTPTLDLPAEIIEKIVRTDPELFRTCRAVSKSWEGECSRLAGLARNRIPLSTITWNIPRKGRGAVLRRRRQILASLRIPQMFQAARFNSFTSFLLNHRLMDQARQLTTLELEITKPFLQLSEESIAKCGLQLYTLLTEAQNLTSFKFTVSPKRYWYPEIHLQDKFFARVNAFERSIFSATNNYDEDPTKLRQLIVNNCAFRLFENVFCYIISISPSLEEVTVLLSPQYPVSDSDSDSMQKELSNVYKTLAVVGNLIFQMDKNPSLEFLRRCEPWFGNGEPYEVLLSPIKAGINPTVTILSTREDFIVQDGTAKLQSLLEKTPTLRIVDPSFLNDGRRF